MSSGNDATGHVFPSGASGGSEPQFLPEFAVRNGLSASGEVPGRAWLEFEVVPDGGGALIYQTAVFEPAGLPGLLYWYALFPAHAVIFGGMLRQIAQRARVGR